MTFPESHAKILVLVRTYSTTYVEYFVYRFIFYSWYFNHAPNTPTFNTFRTWLCTSVRVRWSTIIILILLMMLYHKTRFCLFRDQSILHPIYIYIYMYEEWPTHLYVEHILYFFFLFGHSHSTLHVWYIESITFRENKKTNEKKNTVKLQQYEPLPNIAS